MKLLARLVVAMTLTCAVCELAIAQDDEEVVVEEPKEEKKEQPSAVKAVLAYALVLGGLAVVGVGVAKTFTSSLSYLNARLMLVNLLRTNPYQAEHVCRNMKHTFFEPIGAALKTGATTQSRDPAVIATATRPTYDAIGTTVSMHWKTLVGKTKLAGMALGGGVAIALTGKSTPVFLIILGVLGLAGLIWVALYKMQVDRSITRARAEILPEAERAIIDGRYVAPPTPGQ